MLLGVVVVVVVVLLKLGDIEAGAVLMLAFTELVVPILVVDPVL